jgi:POT family proton-dependent oligopeptide transporter
MVVISIIIFFNQKIVKIPAASESPLKNAWATLMISLKQGGLEKAKPSYLVEHNRLEKYKFARTEKYTDLYVEEVKKGLKACKVSPHRSRRPPDR